jgi:hypothetical protein
MSIAGSVLRSSIFEGGSTERAANRTVLADPDASVTRRSVRPRAAPEVLVREVLGRLAGGRGHYAEDPSIVPGAASVPPPGIAGTYASVAHRGFYHQPLFLSVAPTSAPGPR